MSNRLIESTSLQIKQAKFLEDSQSLASSTSPEQRSITDFHPNVKARLFQGDSSFRRTIVESNKHVKHNSTVDSGLTWTYGILLLLATYVYFAISMYAIVISKFMPYTGNKLLDAIKDDHYYCYLVPITIPVTLAAIVMNWMGMKFFRHN
ncbi:hypothetical protein MIR68_006012 [Amoeboaphelidium protococcarum]|nr:hypothetical protein MIR68_006012 [Amoeboaphelidium protococcarum]